MPQNVIYEVRTQRELKPGYSSKVATIYLSPSGEEVSKAEATIAVMEIVEIFGGKHSEYDRKAAIDKLIKLLMGQVMSQDLREIHDANPFDSYALAKKALRALETMAREYGMQAEVAMKILDTQWGDFWDDTSARCLAAKLLGECGYKSQEALSKLTGLKSYSINTGNDHYEGGEKPVHEAAEDALAKLQAG